MYSCWTLLYASKLKCLSHLVLSAPFCELFSCKKKNKGDNTYKHCFVPVVSLNKIFRLEIMNHSATAHTNRKLYFPASYHTCGRQFHVDWCAVRSLFGWLAGENGSKQTKLRQQNATGLEIKIPLFVTSWRQKSTIIHVHTNFRVQWWRSFLAITWAFISICGGNFAVDSGLLRLLVFRRRTCSFVLCRSPLHTSNHNRHLRWILWCGSCGPICQDRNETPNGEHLPFISITHRSARRFGSTLPAWLDTIHDQHCVASLHSCGRYLMNFLPLPFKTKCGGGVLQKFMLVEVIAAPVLGSSNHPHRRVVVSASHRLQGVWWVSCFQNKNSSEYHGWQMWSEMKERSACVDPFQP